METDTDDGREDRRTVSGEVTAGPSDQEGQRSSSYTAGAWGNRI